MDSPIVSKYKTLLRLFTERQISAVEFEEIFLPLFQFEHTQPSSEAQGLLLELFRDVDSFNAFGPPAPDEIDEDELRLRAAKTLGDLPSQ